MDLALARMKNNLGQLRGPVQRSAHEALTRGIAGRVKLAHLRYYFGAALFAALVGIGVNALLLQRERHWTTAGRHLDMRLIHVVEHECDL